MQAAPRCARRGGVRGRETAIGIYTIPEVSFVGATESELTRNSVPYEFGISRYRELARGQIAGD